MPESTPSLEQAAITPLPGRGHDAPHHAVLQEDREQGAPLAQEAWVKGAAAEAGVDAELVEVGGVDQAAWLAQLR